MPLEFLSPLHKTTRQISLYLERRTRDLGVSLGEGHLLTYLASYAPAPIAELVRVFGIKQSTFTSMLDRLERAGLTRREINPDDRRSFLIHITDRGRRLATELNHHLTELENRIRKQTSAGDARGFQAVMDAVQEITGVELRRR